MNRNNLINHNFLTTVDIDATGRRLLDTHTSQVIPAVGVVASRGSHHQPQRPGWQYSASDFPYR